MRSTKRMTREQLERAVQQLQKEKQALERATKSYTMIVRKTRIRPRFKNTSHDIMSSVVFFERLMKDLE